MSNIAYFSWIQRTVVEAGPGCRTYAPLRMSSMGSTRPALLTDQNLVKVGVPDPVKEIFEVQGSPRFVGVYDKISPEFTGTEASECARWCRENAVDGIVAVGGGSVLDCAKAVKCMIGMKATNLWDLSPTLTAVYTEPTAKPLGTPLIAFPTTAGTGCEVSAGIVCTHEDLHVKGFICHPFMNPEYAFLDADLTVSLPPHVTAHTGFDALCHSIEGLTSLTTNDMIDSYAIHSIKMIRKYLPMAVKDGKDILARHKMLVASNMAIVSFFLAGFYYPVHNIAHALGAALKVPHGEANMIALPFVLDTFTAHYLPHSDALAQAFDLDPRMTPKEIVSGAAQAIRDLQAVCGFSNPKYKTPRLDEAMIGNLCMAVKLDPVGAIYQIPQAVVKLILLSACEEVK